MGEVFKNTYFLTLPNEVLIKILRNIDTVSLLHFCEAYGCDYFLEDRNVIQTVDLQKNYILHDLNEVSTKINNYEYVTTLNINGLYWVQSSKLRKFISMLPNLERLYAVNSNLSLTKADVRVYSKMKIKKLAVSVDGNEPPITTQLPTIETLYINANSAFGGLHCSILEMVCPNFKKIWVNIDQSPLSLLFPHNIESDTKFKVYCNTNTLLLPMKFNKYGPIPFYDNSTCNSYMMCMERFTTPTNPCESNAWQVLEELRYGKPYGPRDANRLSLNGNRLDGMFFEELNFAHNGLLCKGRCRVAVREILLSANVQRLRKLCIMTCLFQDERTVEPNYEKNSKRRRCVETSTSPSVQDYFDNFRQLEELSMFMCTDYRIDHRSAIPGFHLIGCFENLQSLKLQVPLSSDGSFLPDIFLKCRRLQVLRISSSSRNENLDFNLCNSVHEATSLKDFVYENHGIHFDWLLEQLSSIKSHKLQRIVLNCSEVVGKFSGRPFKNFMEMNPQLIFVFFAISNLTIAAHRMVQKILNVYENKHPAKAFFVNKGIEEIESVPDVHYSDLMKSNGNIDTLNTIQEFELFYS